MALESAVWVESRDEEKRQHQQTERDAAKRKRIHMNKPSLARLQTVVSTART
jgi:hypothetical protein